MMVLPCPGLPCPAPTTHLHHPHTCTLLLTHSAPQPNPIQPTMFLPCPALPTLHHHQVRDIVREKPVLVCDVEVMDEEEDDSEEVGVMY